VAKRPVYKSETVYFERFCYDLVSLFGVNILFLEINQLELIIRKLYKAVSFNFTSKEGNDTRGILLRAVECVEPAFEEDLFSEVKQ